MSRGNRFLCAVIVLPVLGMVLGCAPKEKTIKIGIAGPMTGDQAKMGTDILHGVRLAIEEWNAKGGVLGKRIELEIGDDRRSERGCVRCREADQ